MPWPKGTPRPEASGRKKGTPNKITADIKALAQEYGPRAIAVLADILKTSKSEQAKIAAAKELMDRGFGKSVQRAEHSGPEGGPIEHEHTLDIGAAEALRHKIRGREAA